MADDLTPIELAAADDSSPPVDPASPPRRTSRVLVILFALFLGVLGTIALTPSAQPANASVPHGLRAIAGEGCGGG